MKMVTIRVGMRISDDEVQMEMTLPAAPTRLESLLPLFQRVADELVGLAAERAVTEGRTISCTKGCGACCRQIVPITQVEARRIARLVEALPEPRRTEIRTRFDRARRRLEEAGILSKLRDPEGFEAGDFSPFGLAYFRLGIPCPFLEEESCSIHGDRPITCREYLVTSPAADCADPRPGMLDRVEMPVKVWTALARAGAPGPPTQFAAWVPLVLALDWAAKNPDGDEPRPAEELVRSVFAEMGRLTGGEKAGGGGPEPA